MGLSCKCLLSFVFSVAHPVVVGNGNQVLQGVFTEHNPFVMNDVSLPSAETVARNIDVDFTFWSFDVWDAAEEAFFRVDDDVLWRKTRPSATTCVGWQMASSTFPPKVNTAFQCTSHVTVSILLDPSRNRLKLEFGTTINGDQGEQWAVSDVVVRVISLGPQPSITLFPHTTMALTGWSNNAKQGLICRPIYKGLGNIKGSCMIDFKLKEAVAKLQMANRNE